MTPRRGEVWFATLSPTEGREQSGRRPVLILSDDRFNGSGAELVIVLPITSRVRSYPTRIALAAREGGLKAASFIIGEQVRTISVTRLTRRLGTVEGSTMARVEQVVRRLLGLEHDARGPRPVRV